MSLLAARSLTVLALLLAAALFGFFYAWICSTMWGLDAADPRVAIAAMQAMNASVRNVVFAPAFFGTAPALALAGALAFLARRPAPGALLVLAGLTVVLGAVAPTLIVNVPMNQNLAAKVVPLDVEAAGRIWAEYSPRWQFWNLTRTVSCGTALLIALWGFARLVQPPASRAFGR